MKSILTGVLASLAVLGLVSACSDDPKSSDSTGGSTGTTLAPGDTTADGSTAGGGDTTPQVTLPPGVTFPSGPIGFPPGMTLPTLPPGLTIPPGGTFPSDLTIPIQFIDQMMTQLEAAGLNVDRACVENLLNDQDFRNVVMSGSTPSSEMVTSLIACFKA